MEREMERDRRKKAAEGQRPRPNARTYPREVKTAKEELVNIRGDLVEAEGGVI